MLDTNSNSFVFTARDFSETLKLLHQNIGNNYKVIGKHYGKKRIAKLSGLIKRFTEIKRLEFDYDISISCGSENAIWYSKLKRKNSIAFGDNDLAKQWTYGLFVDFCFFPTAIDTGILLRQGISKEKLFQYNGYKEDIYIADFIPDKDFITKLPFNNYVVVRPENVKANYVASSASITPRLLELLSSKGINIVYLPRYDSDRQYAAKLKNVYIPKEPLNGLDLCYNADAVLTGAGTFAREASCLNVPSFSFFAGNRLMAVDKELINKNKMFFSRNADELVEKVIISSKLAPDLKRSKTVKEELREKLLEVVSLWRKKD